jgi:hypothetical protein
MGDSREAWIWVEVEVPTTILNAHPDITSFKLRVVDEIIDASTLQTEDAEKISRKANQDYSRYLWKLVPARNAGEFVVRGELRSDA